MAEKMLQRLQLLKKKKRNKEEARKDAEDEKKARAVLSSPGPTPITYTPDELMSRLKGQICRAMFKSFLAMRQLKVRSVLKNDYPFGAGWPGRFEQRFRSFGGISNPPFMSFDQYNGAVETHLKVEGDVMEIMNAVGTAFKQAKTIIEELRKFHALLEQNNLKLSVGPHDIIPASTCTQFLKVCIAGSLNVLKFQETLKSHLNGNIDRPSRVENFSLTLNFSHHAHFPVTVLDLSQG